LAAGLVLGALQYHLNAVFFLCHCSFVSMVSEELRV
jgi:hypothetical protein